MLEVNYAHACTDGKVSDKLDAEPGLGHRPTDDPCRACQAPSRWRASRGGRADGGTHGGDCPAPVGRLQARHRRRPRAARDGRPAHRPARRARARARARACSVGPTSRRPQARARARARAGSMHPPRPGAGTRPPRARALEKLERVFWWAV